MSLRASTRLTGEYGAIRLLTEFGGVGGRSEFGQGPDGAVGHTGEHVGQILADGDREPAAALDHGEDGGDFGTSLLASPVQPVAPSDGYGRHGVLCEIVAQLQHRMNQEAR